MQAAHPARRAARWQVLAHATAAGTHGAQAHAGHMGGRVGADTQSGGGALVNGAGINSASRTKDAALLQSPLVKDVARGILILMLHGGRRWLAHFRAALWNQARIIFQAQPLPPGYAAHRGYSAYTALSIDARPLKAALVSMAWLRTQRDQGLLQGVAALPTQPTQPSALQP